MTAAETPHTRQIDSEPEELEAPEHPEVYNPSRDGGETFDADAEQARNGAGAVAGRRFGTPAGAAVAASMHPTTYIPANVAIAAVESAALTQAVAIVGRSSLPVR